MRPLDDAAMLAAQSWRATRLELSGTPLSEVVTRRVILLPLVTARREPRAVEVSRLEPWVRVETAPDPAVTAPPVAAPSGAEASPGLGITGVGGALGGSPQTSQ